MGAPPPGREATIAVPGGNARRPPAQAGPLRKAARLWPLALLVTSAQFTAASDRFLIALVTGPLKQGLSLTDAQLGLLLGSAFVLLYGLAMPLFGILADRGHQRTILLGSVAVWTLATLGFGLAGSFAALLLARVALGFGQAGVVPACLSLIAHHADRRRMGFLVSLFTAGGALGQSFALLTGGLVLAWLAVRGSLWFPGLGDLAPWRALFVLACLLNLLPFVLAALIRLQPTPVVARPGLRTAFAWVLRRRGSYLPHFGAAAAAVLMGRTLAAWGPTFYMRSHGMSPAESGVTLGLLLLVGGPLGHLIAGLLLDRVPSRRRRSAASAMLGLGLLLALPTVAVLALAPDRIVSLGAFVVLMAILGFTAPAAVSGIQWLTPVALRGRVSALFVAATTLTATGTGPALLGLLSDTVYGPDRLGPAMITLFLGVGLPGLWLARRAARTPRRRRSSAGPR